MRHGFNKKIREAYSILEAFVDQLARELRLSVMGRKIGRLFAVTINDRQLSFNIENNPRVINGKSNGCMI